MDPHADADAFHRLEAVRSEIESLIALRAYGPLLSGQQRRYDGLLRQERELLRDLNSGGELLGEVATP